MCTVYIYLIAYVLLVVFTSKENFQVETQFLLDGQQRITTIFLILRAIYLSQFLVEEDFSFEDQAQEIDQDWEAETTQYNFIDNSCIVICGPCVNAYNSQD